MPSSFPLFATCVGVAALVAGCHDKASSSPAASSSASSDPPASAEPSASAPASASHAFPIPSASVQAVLNPDNLPAYAGPTGSVEGTITVRGPAAPDVKVDVAKCPAALDTYGKLFREGKPDSPNGPRWLADAVVVAVGYTGYLPAKDEVVRTTIRPDCAYPSRTIAVTYGQRIEVSNQSKLLFAPVIDQETTPAVMVAPPGENGDPVRIYPRRAGYFTMTDRVQTFVREDL